MTDTFASVNHAKIEARARALRAQAARDGVLAFKAAVVRLYQSIFAGGARHA